VTENRQTLKIVAIAGVFLLVLSVIGYMSISQSNYQDLAGMLSLEKKTKVTVEAEVQPIGTGEMLLHLNGITMTLTGYGSYAVATDPSGKVYAVFLLTDGSNTVLALYEAGEEYLAGQMGSGLMSSVVVTGVYDPSVRAVLETPYGGYEYPVLYVDAILKGCHSGYTEQAATTG